MTTRRRFLTISAAALALPAAGFAQPVHTWQGAALGTTATLRLAHPDAKAISARVAAEISRLEDVFSLYRPQSALMRLNREGHLAAPPFELLECLSLAAAVHAASGGRFDPTVQPLWAAYAEASALGTLPDDASLSRARAQAGWERVALDPASITMAPGMALTLNGIAQGYIADRIAGMLETEGLTDILIDTGEFRALGGRPDGSAWPVKLAAGGSVALRARALATSAPLGTTFDERATLGHILDPVTGKPARAMWREITVSARSAALADALSTAACLFEDAAQMQACIVAFEGAALESAIAA
ncbi:thiamine biosynthesis protein ApbE [Pelagivirga sediminicola]|uniref:FAD:protein FMN transferase n=1 Tax=Pelagivirga sediminicola TaxID=2170575 RepID=A0A2T7GB86_9RHOB|nr:FAD:protein FMN transferase [Pelagivirga sediminicola]PVA11690.1 thiamine biosynthesis protein ApbE [Pelagivirga sediminicola]